jgi:hypothetical protein
MQVNSPNGSLLHQIAAFFRGPQQQQPTTQVQSGPVGETTSRNSGGAGDRAAFAGRTVVEPPTGGYNPNARRGTYVNILV